MVTIGATNRPEVLDMALRRPGRFDREIDVGVPGARARAQILKHCLKRITHDVPEKDIESLAADMHGFVAADVDALAQEAAMQTLREYVDRKTAAEAEGRDIGMDDLCVHLSQLQHAASVIKPSALREVAIEIPKVRHLKSPCPFIGWGAAVRNEHPRDQPHRHVCYVQRVAAALPVPSRMDRNRWSALSSLCTWRSLTAVIAAGRHSECARRPAEVQVTWDDVGGLDELKQQLRDIAADAKIDPEIADEKRLLQPRGLLLYGAPGCSKTLLARAFAAEGGLNFIAVRCTDIFSKYVGESEKAIAKTFSRARQAAPAVVFFDEIDGLMRARGDEGTGVCPW